jgi:cytoskeletal protein CcmA (bactofilin family)
MREHNGTAPPIQRYSGNSTIPGGNYASEIHVSGRNKILGDLECKGFTCSGWVTCQGNLIVHGPMRVSGRFKGEADVIVEGHTDLSGIVTIKRNLTVLETLNNSGIFKVDGDVKARRFKLGGIPRIRGRIYYVENLKPGDLARISINPIRIRAEDLAGAPKPLVETPQEAPQPAPSLTIAPPPRCCPFCGAELDEKAQFCEACGNKIE